MNRQQRRILARQREQEQRFEDRYGREIIERQNRVDDRVVEMNALCMALAVYDEYGYMPKRIHRIVTAYCRRMTQFAESDQTYEDLKQELKEKTGVEFVWRE